jgi:hypothetical protein
MFFLGVFWFFLGFFKFCNSRLVFFLNPGFSNPGYSKKPQGAGVYREIAIIIERWPLQYIYSMNDKNVWIHR